MHGRVLIVGASAAGVAAAEALQRLVPDREVLLLGDEDNLAHDRPPLSKQVLEGVWQPVQAQLLPPFRREALKAKLMLGRRATGVDIDRRRVRVDDGSSVAYDDLVVATGVRPRELPGGTPSGVYVLRNMADSLALREAILACNVSRLAIVGGGFIGLEVAATARKLSIPVTVIEPMPKLLGRRIGEASAQRLIDLHRQRGVDFRFNAGVAAIQQESGKRGATLTLTDGTTIAAGAVLVSIGCMPNVEWLAQSGLDISNGVLCDEYCQAAPHVWAAGDVARWLHAGLGRHVRVEHRMNASEQGAAVAANIAGERQKYLPTPFFWTDQYNVRLQLAGALSEGAHEEMQQLDDDSFLHTFRIDGRLVAALGWNAAKAMMPLRRELADSLK
jgi:NADPH-dependent 2,4-dienoyl-CoA reductase/sulfur reductase-like enzyme